MRRGEREERNKRKEGRESSRSLSRVFEFSKPEYISYSDFRNTVLFLHKLTRVFNF